MDNKITTSAVDQENRVLANLPEPEYEVEYPNYKMELRDRQYSYRPSRVPSIADRKKLVGNTLKYQHIPMCGHSFVPEHEPRHRNCESCWFAFFQVHGEMTQAVEQLYQTNPEILLNLKGKKFVRNFLKFMSTVAAFQASVQAVQAQAETAKEKDVISTGSTESGDEQVTGTNEEGSSGSGILDNLFGEGTTSTFIG